MPARYATLFGRDVDLIVEIGFDSDPTVAISSTVWTDVSSDVREWTWRAGKQNELDRFEAGQGAIILDNRSGDYDPSNTVGPYFGLLKPRRRLRIAVQVDAVRTEIASGFVNRWIQGYETKQAGAGIAVTGVDFSDAFGVFAQTELLDSALANEIFVTQRTSGVDAVWYRLGENLNETREAADSFGDKARTGTYVETPTSVSGLAFLSDDGAVEFKSSADIGDAVKIANMAAAYPITIEAMIKVETDAVGGVERAVIIDARFSTGPATTDTGNLLWIVTNDGAGEGPGRLRVQTFQDGPGLRRISTFGRVDDGRPHHVAVRLNSATSFELFIDGVEDTDPATEVTIGSGTAALDANAFWYIGPFVQFVTPPDPATLDEVVIWRASLSNGEIAAHALAGLDTDDGARPEAAFGGDTVLERFTRILDFARWPTADRDIDVGNTILQSTGLGGSALAYLQLVTDTEFGAFFMDPGGNVRVRERHALFTEARHTNVQVTFGDGVLGETPYTEIDNPVLDDERIRNFALIARERGAQRTAQDATSIDEHYIRRFVRDGLLHADDLVSQDYADFIIANFAQPQSRVDQVEVDPRSDSTVLDAITSLQFEDRVRVIRRPPGGHTFDGEFHVVGIEHESTASPREWRVRYQLVPVGALGDDFWLIGVVGRSEIGETTVVGF